MARTTNHRSTSRRKRRRIPRAQRKSTNQYPAVRSLQAYLTAQGRGNDGRKNREAFARRAGTSVAYLYQLAVGFRQASPAVAIEVEKASLGQVRCEHLAPDADWGYMEARKPAPTASGGTGAPRNAAPALG